MLALLGALGLALNPVNTTPVANYTTNVVNEDPEPTPEPEEDPTWKDKITDLLNNQLVSNIVNWCITGGSFVALIVVFAKYKAAKYKTTMDISKDIEEHAIKYFTDYVTNYYDKALEGLNKGQAIIEKNMTVIVNAFILAQDHTAKGKAALLEYLDRNIEKKDEETKEKIEEQQEKTNAQIEKEDEVIEKIQNDDEESKPID